MALWKLGFVIDQYGRKSELPNYVYGKPSMPNFNKIWQALYGIYGDIQAN
jgi:hypothetical protein